MALDYTCQICNAVDHAHRHGVLHRDLRPSNVIVTDSGMLKVADFGTSRFLEIAAHGTTVIGSPPYMAPEQFQGKAVFASDIYSLGVTMFQMLTGVLPYDTPSPADLDRLMRGELLIVRRGSRTRRCRRRSTTSSLKAMAPEIPARYQRAGELLDDVLAVPRHRGGARPRSRAAGDGAGEDGQDIQSRLKARGDAASHASAGIAASRCTRAPTAARSAARPSSPTAEWAVGNGRMERRLAQCCDSASAVPNCAESIQELMSWFFRDRQDLDERQAGRVEGCDDSHRARTSSTTAAACSRARGATRRRRAPPASGWTSICVRLQHSAKIYRMEYPLDLAGWRDAVLETIRANEMKACYIRPLIYRGYDTLGVNPLANPVDAAIMRLGMGRLSRRRTRSRAAWT